MQMNYDRSTEVERSITVVKRLVLKTAISRLLLILSTHLMQINSYRSVVITCLISVIEKRGI